MKLKLAGLALLILCLIPSLHAQAPAGFTKIASATTASYTDMTVALNTIYAYEVTATNGPIESAASGLGIGSVPATAPTTANAQCGNMLIHCAIVTWPQPSGGVITPTGWNVYRRVVTAADLNPPGAPTVAVP